MSRLAGKDEPILQGVLGSARLPGREIGIAEAAQNHRPARVVAGLLGGRLGIEEILDREVIGAKRQPLVRTLHQRVDHAGIGRLCGIGDSLAGVARSDRHRDEGGKAKTD